MNPNNKFYIGPEHKGDEAICLNRVSYSYPDGCEAIKDIDLHVTVGSTLALVGPNGAGKTTLLKIMLGLLTNYKGHVLMGGLSPEKAQRAGGVIAWVPQRQNLDWNFPINVQQAVRMGLVGKTGMFRKHKKKDLEFADSIMEMLGISNLASRHIGALSGGQQQRAMIGRALAANPSILMMDEPTVGVDQSGQERFLKLLDSIKEDFGVTLVVVSHDLRTVLNICQRIACLNKTLHFHDTPQKLTADTIEHVFHINLDHEEEV